MLFRVFLAQLDEAVAQDGGVLEFEHTARLLHLLFELSDLFVPLALGELALAAAAGGFLVLLGNFDDLAHILSDGLRNDAVRLVPAFTMDYKCPDSGMENAMNTDNFSLLIPKDTVKFVVSSISDLDKARKICIQYKVAEHCPIFLSPVFGRIEPKEIVEYMIEHHWNEARLQLQMHKFIWPPEQRGV